MAKATKLLLLLTSSGSAKALLGQVQQMRIFTRVPELSSFNQTALNLGLPKGGQLTVNHTEAYQSACLADLGQIAAPLSGVGDAPADSRVVEVLPGLRGRSVPLALV